MQTKTYIANFVVWFQNLYETDKVEYLLVEGDTVHEYEERGKSVAAGGSSHDRGMEALSSMDRVQQGELLSGKKQNKVQLFIFDIYYMEIMID